jgi:outer membrane immunogenic protein
VNAGGTFGASDSIGRLGGSIGFQAGYGFMFGPRLYAGVEAGVGTGNISGSDTGRRTTEVLTEGANFSLGGRLGVAFDDLLLYGTGGFNVVETEYTRTRGRSIKSDGEWVVIPVVGVGIETKVAPNVGVGVRYTSELRPAVEYLDKHEADAVRSDSIKGYINYYPSGSATPGPQRRPFSWTGFYLGGNVGAAGGTNEFGEPQGGSVGGHVGHGTTVGPAYFGVESGYNFRGVGWSRMMGGVTEQQTQNGLVAVRGRFGIATPGALVYATGGVAFANTEFSIHGMGFHDVDKKWHRGLTAGLGLEVPLTASLSAGLQYEFASFAGGEYFDGTVKVGGMDLHGLNFIVNYRLGPN